MVSARSPSRRFSGHADNLPILPVGTRPHGNGSTPYTITRRNERPAAYSTMHCLRQSTLHRVNDGRH